MDPTSAPSPLRLLDRTLPGTEANLALDEALLLESERRSLPPLLRFWEPTELAVILGASARLRTDVQLASCRRDGVRIARRSSGGGTVVIGPGTLCVAAVLPVGFDPALAWIESAQRFVLERFATGLRSARAVEVLGSGDLTIGGRKFGGSAQRRLRRTVLVHATILNAFPLELIDAYLHHPPREPVYRAGRPHRDFLCNLGWDTPTLRDALLAGWGGCSIWEEAEDIPAALVDQLIREKLGDPAWVERF